MPSPTSTPTTRRTRREAPATVQLSETFYINRTAHEAETTLDHLGRRVLASETVLVDGQRYHTGDRALCGCESCGGNMLRDRRVSVITTNNACDTRSWCPSCASESNVWSCTNCGATVSRRVSRAYRDDDIHHERPLCRGCCPVATNSIFGRMLNYSNKEINNIPPKDGSGMLYGWEVEVHVTGGRNPNDIVAELFRRLGGGYYVTKPDGSVDNGFEIVTRPDAMHVHREEWEKFFEAVHASPLLRDSLRSHQSPRQCCGIHCHIDKSALSQMQLGKLNVWLNHPDNRSFIERIAGRGSNSYTSFKNDVKIIDGRRLKAGASPERYVALNVTQHTAEMRIFRGTLNPKLFFKNLDFVEASVVWTGMANCSAKSVTKVDAFKEFVRANRNQYYFLNMVLDEWQAEGK